MDVQFPLNTLVSILSLAILTAAVVAFAINNALSRISASTGTIRRWQIAVVAALALWFVVRMILGQMRLVPQGLLIGLGFVVTFSMAILPMLFSPFFRNSVLSVPQSKLVGIQTFRVGGFVFLALLDMHLLPASFAIPAGYGDVAVGLTAPLVRYALSTNKSYARWLAIAWNFFGLADFAVALITGILFIAPHIRQLAMTGHPVNYLDYILIIPGFIVPVLTLAHMVSLYNLLPKRAASEKAA